MSELKLFFFRSLSDWMSVIHSLSLCSVIDMIESCNLHVYGPQLYTPYMRERLYFLISIKIALPIKSIIKNCDFVVGRFYEICG